MRRAGIAAVLLLAGCTLHTATEGPVTVVLGPAERIARLCTELTRQPSRGCLTWRGTSLVLRCGYNDVECLAHEVRHVYEPHWRHD